MPSYRYLNCIHPKYQEKIRVVMLKAVLFDLDGTLLPMDQDVFVKTYFSLLAKRLAPYGYDPEKLIQIIWKAISAEMSNDGSKTNQEVFWDVFTSAFGEKSREQEPVFDDFYRTEFNTVASVCDPSPKANEIVKMLKKAGCMVILATNPIFPRVATDNRIRWAGMDRDDFDEISTFENYGLCKPNPEYFRFLLKKFDLKAEECIMVGNDVDEDMIASELGMKVFLMDYFIINRKNKDLRQFPVGGFDELKVFLEKELKN